jgi:hypothetical protein
LGLGEELGVSLNGGEVVTAGKQGHGDAHQQRPTRIGAVGTARVGEVLPQELAQGLKLAILQ